MNTQIATGVSRIFLVVFLAVAAIILIVWFQNRVPVGGPTVTVSNGTTTPSSQAVLEVDAITLDNVEKEFQAIDSNINAL